MPGLFKFRVRKPEFQAAAASTTILHRAQALNSGRGHYLDPLWSFKIYWKCLRCWKGDARLWYHIQPAQATLKTTTSRMTCSIPIQPDFSTAAKRHGICWHSNIDPLPLSHRQPIKHLYTISAFLNQWGSLNIKLSLQEGTRPEFWDDLFTWRATWLYFDANRINMESFQRFSPWQLINGLQTLKYIDAGIHANRICFKDNLPGLGVPQ